jgi:hypothetical protein
MASLPLGTHHKAAAPYAQETLAAEEARRLPVAACQHTPPPAL